MAGPLIGKGLSAAGQATQNAATKAYLSALKPSKKVPIATQQKIADVGLGRTGEGFIGTTKKGLDKLSDTIDIVNTDISSVIDNSTGTILTDDILARVKSSLEVVKDAPNSNQVTGEIMKYLDEVRGSKGPVMTVQDAQGMKRYIYRRLKDAYGEMSSVMKQVDKDIARGAKEEIYNLHPELQQLNARDSGLLELERVLDDAVKRIGKRDTLGLTEGGAVIAGALSGGASKAWEAGMIAKIIKSPAIQARIAFLVNKAAAMPMAAKNISLMAGYGAGKAVESSQRPSMNQYLPKPVSP
jgi:hypothetical protein